MDRRHIVYNGDEIVEDYLEDFTWSMIRNEREGVLERSDYMFMSDQNPTQEWIDYRQFLRDLPQNYDTANDAADAWAAYDKPE
tara:strand:+ start:1680 stop:1928 length:249 start_codon:yes stop_codon:yes gene_type:complete